jgi:Ca2+-binding RTX toxin-like protein
MKTIGSPLFGGDDTYLAANMSDPTGIVHLPVTPLAAFAGTAGDDNLTGTSGDDSFDLTAGGNDTVQALGGNDIIQMGNTLTAADAIDGGDGFDNVMLSGTYGGLTLGATTLTNVEDLTLAAGASYTITTNDGNVAAGQNLQVDASQLTGANKLVFDGSAETDGNFTVIGGGGNDVITTGNGPDFVDASLGGNDTINLGGDANDPLENGDFVYFGAAFTSNDQVNGGDPANIGNAAIQLSGNYAANTVLKATTIQNIGAIVVATGSHQTASFSYFLTENDANLGAGQNMVVTGNSLVAGETLRFDGSAETDGSFNMTGGLGNDVLIGGAGDDFFKPRGGDDFVDGGGGKNRLTYSDDTHGVTVSLLNHSAQNTGDGMDTLRNIQDLSGGAGNDALTGDNNANWLWGEGGSDNIQGLNGNDIIQVGTLNGTLGTDTADGGNGSDTLSFDDNGTQISGVTFSLALQGTSQVTGMDTLTATNFENVTGTSLGDAITGDANNNILYGSGGDDVLNGGAGNDTLYGDKVLVPSDAQSGGDGPTDVQDYDNIGANDTLQGGVGIDTLDGGLGNDTASYTDATSGVIVDLNIAGFQNVGGGDGKDSLISIENLTGSDFGDYLTGDGNDNVLTGGGGNNHLTGNGGDDTIDISGGGNDIVSGGAGDDTIQALGTGAFTANDRIDGGADLDTLVLSGDYSAGVTFAAGTLQNVESIQLGTGFSYRLTTNDATVAAGQNLTVDGSALGAGNTLIFSGAKETDGAFHIIGGAGNDTLVGGANGDSLTGGLGADKLSGGPGSDAYVYNGVAESTGLNHDVITGFDPTQDTFILSRNVAALDSAVSVGTLRTTSFDSDLAAAVSGAHLAAGDAVLFTASAGNLSGHVYLVIDGNGVAGYQAAQDYVIELNASTNLGSLGTADFINP